MAMAFSSVSRFSLCLDRRSFSASRIPSESERRVANAHFDCHRTVRLPSLSRFPSVRKLDRGVITLATPQERDEITDPPPDLSSHLFKNRIVYLGLPLIPEVVEILIAQLIFLQEEDPQKPIYLYINSTGVVQNDPRLGYETEAFALYDIMRVIEPPIFTLCVGNAWGDAALLLAAGARGNRAALPSTSIMIKEPLCRFQGQASSSENARNEMKNMKNEMVHMLAKHTGQPPEKIEDDIKQPKYFTPTEAVAYGLIDKVLSNEDGPDGNVISQLSRVQFL